jgi:NADPH2:quinone reductase
VRAWACAGDKGLAGIVLRALPIPVPRPGELLVRTEAVGLNRADVYQARGLYPPPEGAPDVPGLEIAGTVEEAPADSGYSPGDKVCALLASGGYAEYAAVPVGHALPLPDGVTIEDAAGIPEAYATAWHNLVGQARLREGGVVCIHAAASGVGLACIHTASVLGVRAVGVVRQERKRAAVLGAGAERCFLYSEDYVAGVLTLTGGNGADASVDPVGRESFAQNLELLAQGGRLVVIGFLSGARIEASLIPLLMKNLSIVGSTLRYLPASRKTRILAAMRGALWKEFERGRISPVTDRVFPFSEAGEALSYMQENRHIGKIVLRI